MQEIINIISVALPLVFLYFLMTFCIRTVRHPKRIITESNGMKKISTNPSIFGGSSQKQYYYDDEYLYEVKNDVTYKIAFSEIIQIKPGYTKINNRRNWLVSYHKNGVSKQVEFFHNLTLFNHNFSGFLLAVKQANPDADVKTLSFFNL